MHAHSQATTSLNCKARGTNFFGLSGTAQDSDSFPWATGVPKLSWKLSLKAGQLPQKHSTCVLQQRRFGNTFVNPLFWAILCTIAGCWVRWASASGARRSIHLARTRRSVTTVITSKQSAELQGYAFPKFWSVHRNKLRRLYHKPEAGGTYASTLRLSTAWTTNCSAIKGGVVI